MAPVRALRCGNRGYIGDNRALHAKALASGEFNIVRELGAQVRLEALVDDERRYAAASLRYKKTAA